MGETSLDRVSILLVDDHEENLIALEAILSDPQFNLVKATSVTEVLREVLRNDFAVILLDVMMPEMDGFELATLIRKREKNKDTPIIFLTAIAKEMRHIYHGYGVGAVDYIAKPLDPLVVLAKVRIFADLFRKSQKIAAQAELLRQTEIREREYQILRLKEQSERRYRQLAEAIPQIVWRASPSGILEYFNQQWNEYDVRSIQGNPEQERGWRDFSSTFHPEDFAGFINKWQESLHTLEVFEYQCRIRPLRSPQFRWHLCRAYPAPDGAGGVEAWLGTWTDIHDQKVSEQRQDFLVQAGKQLSSSLDYLTTLRYITDLVIPYLGDWCTIDMRDAKGTFRRARVWHADESKAHLAECLAKLPIGVTEDHFGIALALKSQQPTLVSHLPSVKLEDLAGSLEVRKILEELGTHSLISIPIEIRGQCVGAITVVCGDSHRTFGERDLSLAGKLARHAALAIDNAKLYKVAQDSNRLKDEFLATVSHELRTPLSAVLGWSDLLMEQQHGDEARHCIDIIRRNAKSLAGLVDDLLDISRIISGKILLTIQSVDLKPIVQAAIETIAPAASAKNIAVQCHLDESIPHMKVDPARIQQITWNLVSNAIKFTPNGGHVAVELFRSQEDELVLRVKDDGIGLKPEFIDHVFERFVQADGSTSRQLGGLGLGLAIVRHLVELHGGQVEAASKGEGQGSTFTVRFPLVGAIVSEKPQTERIIEAPVVGRSAEVLNPLADSKILVVDDQPDSRALIARVLERNGAEVRSAASVQEALTFCREDLPDVILTDIGMPDEDGFALLEYIRELEAERSLARIPIAAITAHVGKSIRDKMIANGFDAYLEKPVVFEELIKSVSFLVSQKGRVILRSDVGGSMTQDIGRVQ